MVEYTAEEYAIAMDSEGGFLEAFYNYGLPSHITDAPDEINQTLVQLEAITPLIHKVTMYLTNVYDNIDWEKREG